MDVIRKIERENMRMDMPAFRSGDTVKVYLRIVEGEKERIQIFQGIRCLLRTEELKSR